MQLLFNRILCTLWGERHSLGSYLPGAMDSHQSASLFAAKSFLKHSLSHSSAPRGPLYHAADVGCSARLLSCPSEARGLGTEITPYWVMLAAWVGLGEARPRRLRTRRQIVSRMKLAKWVKRVVKMPSAPDS